MPTIVPWAIPPDYLGAMRSGAALGLDRGRLNLGYANLAQNQEQDVNRLQLAYDQLAAQQGENQADREQRAAIASETLKERALESSLRLMELASRHAAASGHQKEALEAKKAADALRGDYQKGMLAIAQKRADTESRLGLEPELKELFPNSGVFLVRTGANQFQVIDRKKGVKEDLTPAQALSLIARQDAIAGNLENVAGTRKEAANTASQLREYVAEKYPNLLKPVPPQAGTGKSLTKEIAAEFLQQAGGDKEKARKLARDAGYVF